MGTFRQAVEWLKEGKKVRRKDMTNSKFFIFLDEFRNIPYRTTYGGEETGKRFGFNMEHFGATDWEIYCEEHDWITEHKIGCRSGFRQCGLMRCNIEICENCGIEKPKEITLKKRSFSERIAYLKAKFDVGELNEEMYKIQIAATVEDLK